MKLLISLKLAKASEVWNEAMLVHQLKISIIIQVSFLSLAIF